MGKTLADSIRCLKNDMCDTGHALKDIIGLKEEESCIIPAASLLRDALNTIVRNQSCRTNSLYILYHLGFWFRRLGIMAKALMPSVW